MTDKDLKTLVWEELDDGLTNCPEVATWTPEQLAHDLCMYSPVLTGYGVSDRECAEVKTHCQSWLDKLPGVAS